MLNNKIIKSLDTSLVILMLFCIVNHIVSSPKLIRHKLETSITSFYLTNSVNMNEFKLICDRNGITAITKLGNEYSVSEIKTVLDGYYIYSSYELTDNDKSILHTIFGILEQENIENAWNDENEMTIVFGRGLFNLVTVHLINNISGKSID